MTYVVGDLCTKLLHIHYKIYRLRVKIGAERRDQKKGYKEIDVAKMIMHEKYEPQPEFKNDIGLLKLKHAYNNKGSKTYLIVKSIITHL